MKMQGLHILTKLPKKVGGKIVSLNEAYGFQCGIMNKATSKSEYGIYWYIQFHQLQ